MQLSRGEGVNIVMFERQCSGWRVFSSFTFESFDRFIRCAESTLMVNNGHILSAVCSFLSVWHVQCALLMRRVFLIKISFFQYAFPMVHIARCLKTLHREIQGLN